MTTTYAPTHSIAPTTTRAALAGVRRLAGGYFALSAATVTGIALARNDTADVTPAVWTRASIVAATALITYSMALLASRGNRGAFLRLCILTAVQLVAIAVIVALPGAFPVWMRIEQAACGVLVAGIVAVANRPTVTRLFAR